MFISKNNAQSMYYKNAKKTLGLNLHTYCTSYIQCFYNKHIAILCRMYSPLFISTYKKHHKNMTSQARNVGVIIPIKLPLLNPSCMDHKYMHISFFFL